MKTIVFAFFSAVLLIGPARAQVAARGVQLKPLAAEKEASFDDFLANLGVVNTNLNHVLDVFDAPERYTPADVAWAHRSLHGQTKLAADYIAKADDAIARTDLPKTRDTVLIAFPRIDKVENGDDGAGERQTATAEAQVLSAQYSLLNFMTAAAPPADAKKQQDRFKKSVADGHAALAQAGAAVARKP
jgi:hypothetical protein